MCKTNRERECSKTVRREDVSVRDRRTSKEPAGLSDRGAPGY